MARPPKPGIYRDGQYSWIAPPEELQSGRLVPRFRLALLSFTDPRTNTPAPQKILSILSNIPESRLSEYAMGKRPISARNLQALCQIMKLPPEELLGVVEITEVA